MQFDVQQVLSRNRLGQNKGWERAYFFTQNGSLVSHRGAQVCASRYTWGYLGIETDSVLQDSNDVLRLDGAVASLCDVDDRRYVFQVVSKSQPK